MSELEERREDEILYFLKLLGLNLYEARAYLALLSHGSLSPNDLYKVADIPQPRTYDTFERLVKKGFATINPSKKKSYNPVTPQLLKTFLSDVTTELIEERNALRQQLATINEKLALLRKSDLIVSKLSSLFEVKAERSQVLILDGINSISTKLKELIASAEKYIVSTSKLPVLHPIEPIFEEVSKAIQRDVTYRRIVGLELLLSEGLRIVEDDIRSGVQLKWSPEEQLHEKFYVIDDKYVLVRLREPSTGIFKYASIYIESPSFAKFMKYTFDELWQKAHSTLRLMGEIRSKVPKNLEKEEKRVFEALMEYGANNISEISHDLGLSKEKVRESVRKLLRKKLTKRNQFSESYIVNFPQIMKGYA